MSEEENTEKIEEIERKLSELSESIEGIENPAQQLQDEGYLEVKTSERQQIFHYIHVDESASFESCDDVKTSKDAQIVFKEAAEARDADPQNFPIKISHGDILILDCQGTKILNPESESAEEVPDGCYYIGTCSKVDSGVHGLGCGYQEADPHGVCETEENDKGEPLRNFTAWNTCGAAAASGEGHTETFDLVTDVSLSKTEASSSEEGCIDITFTLSVDKEEFVFEEGLLKSKTAISPTQISQTIQVSTCNICPPDDYPTQFTHTIEVTQNSTQLQNAQNQFDPENPEASCITELGGTFTLTRGHAIDAFGSSIAEPDQCNYYMAPTIQNPTACDVLIQYKFVELQPTNQGFIWSANSTSTQIIPFQGTYMLNGHSVAYNLLQPGDQYVVTSSGSTFSTTKTLSW